MSDVRERIVTHWVKKARESYEAAAVGKDWPP